MSDVSATDDIVQDLFVSLWNKKGDFESIEKIKSFLFVSARNACLNELTRLQIHQTKLDEYKAEREYDEIIYTSPDGETFSQNIANELSLKENIIILCGHYKGIDHRIREHIITREISVGDYVLSGGEIPAAMIADAIVRLLPGAISDETSALSDSFQDGMLSAPVYTRPAEFNGWKVPDVLLSGNPKLIREWQDEQAISRTKKLRPNLLDE